MAQPQITGNQSKALRIGQRLMAGAKSFGKGIRRTVDDSQTVISQSARKIKADQKRINMENKKQKRFQENVNEEIARRQKLAGSGGYGLMNTTKKVAEKILIDPMKALWNIILAWTLKNLPKIIEEVRKFVKKVRIVVASINNIFRATGNLFKGWLQYGKAWLRNMVTFDWNDSQGRLREAQQEIDDAQGELDASFDTIYNVWGKEEEELDKMLAFLDDGKTVKQAADAITSGAPLPSLPQTPMVGPGAGGGAGGGGGGGGTDGGFRGTANNYGMSQDAVTNTKWKPILNLIASVESIDGSYSSAYNPRGSRIIPGLENMTIQEAVEASGGTDSNGRHYAIGRYQFTTLTAGQAALANLKVTDKFSPENQDKMAIALIEKKKGVTFDMLRNDPALAQMRLAQEWAGLPKDRTNRSYYGGDGVNAAHTNTAEVRGAFLSALDGGVSGPGVSAGGGATPGNFELVDRVAFSDFSRTRAEGGTGSIGKTSGYGMRWGRMHWGIDIGTGGQRGYGVSIRAKGRVRVSSGPVAGNYVEITTSDNTMYRFLHLRTVFVKNGAQYNGEVIGEIGTTGRSTGIHLHFEVAPRGGGSIDPTPWLHLLTIGKLRAKASGSAVGSNARAQAAELNNTAASRRTNGRQQNTHTVLVTQKTVVAT